MLPLRVASPPPIAALAVGGPRWYSHGKKLKRAAGPHASHGCPRAVFRKSNDGLRWNPYPVVFAGKMETSDKILNMPLSIPQEFNLRRTPAEDLTRS